MFGKNLKKIRSVHGLSQQQFAEMFDLKRATLGAYEEGRSNPKMETVIKIANHFSLDIEDLLTKELTVNRLLKFNEHITVRSEGLQNEAFPQIPCLTKRQKVAFIEALNNQKKINLPMISLPFIDGSDKIAYVVEDASMSGNSPSFLPKDTVIGERIELKNVASASGKLAIIATKNDVLFRKITVSENTLTLQASQYGIDAITLPLSSVNAVWIIVHVFHYNLPNQNEIERRLAMLENAIENLKK